MDLKKNQNIMYRVHEVEEKTKFHVHEILIFTILMCSSGGGRGPAQKIFFSGNILSRYETNHEFLPFSKDECANN